MPLNLYIKKEDVNKTGLKLEERNDAFFNLHIGTTKISDTIKSLILNIDHSTYSSGSDIRTKYGRLVDIRKISTGCKTAINIYSNPDKLFNCVEAGDNALRCILMFNRGNAYMPLLPSIINNFSVDVLLHYMGKKNTLYKCITNTGGARLMAKLLHKRIKVTDGVYSFDFSFHSPVTVIFGNSGIGNFSPHTRG